MEITKIQQQQLVALGVVLCYAHGSVVKGTAMRESDLDIAVLFDTMPKDVLRVTVQVTDILNGIVPGLELDVAVLNEASPLFKHVVAVEGLLLYARSEDDRIRFEVHAMHEYEASKRVRRIGYVLLNARYAAL